MLSLIKSSVLESANKVSVYNWSSYDSSRCSNGGSYGFWTRYTKVSNKWEVTYHTTADFEYCPYCGHFTDRCDCDGPEVISTNEVIEAVNECLDKNDPDKFWVEIDGQRIDY